MRRAGGTQLGKRQEERAEQRAGDGAQRGLSPGERMRVAEGQRLPRSPRVPRGGDANVVGPAALATAGEIRVICREALRFCTGS